MATEDKTRDEKLQFDINQKAAKISALSSAKIDKYEGLAGGEILASNQSRMKERLSLLILIYRSFRRSNKSHWWSRKITSWTFKVLKPDTWKLTINNEIPKTKLSEEAQNDLDKIEQIEKEVSRGN